MKALPIFHIHFIGKMGISIQPIKAKTKELAREKFKKQGKSYKGFEIFDISKSDPTSQTHRYINRHAK
jgi:hypothetical protein